MSGACAAAELETLRQRPVRRLFTADRRAVRGCRVRIPWDVAPCHGPAVATQASRQRRA